MIKKLLFFVFLLTATCLIAQKQAYYNDVDHTLTGIQLKNALATKITTTHTNILDYTPDVWTASKVTDKDPNNANNVLLIYGWENATDGDGTNDKSRNNTFQAGSSSSSILWNREHVYARSLATPGMPDTSIPGISTDAHNLRPADSDRNGTRSNRKFGVGSGTASGNSSVSNGDGRQAWFPGDEWKGDVARIVMYMYLRYGDRCLPSNVGIGDKQFTPDEMIDLFLKWNVEDPVSDIEKARNTYHGNTSISTAQGNRNPFIDNPYLATRIWGGDSAQDLWGIYTSSDTEAPTTPTNVVASNQTTTSMDIAWTASTDNVGVTGYNVYVNDVLTSQTANTTVTISNLSPNTSYALTIEAKDIINNKSAKSTVVNASTLQDTQAPTVPTNIVASNISGTTFKISWTKATDNTAVTGYDIFVDATFKATTANLNYTVTGLTKSTSYSITVLAKDAADNKSAQSTGVNVTTTDGASNGVTELFISEYVEPDGGNNKAIEIVNLTSATIDLSAYSIKKQSNGGSWVDETSLTKTALLVNPSKTTILPNEVFVIIHAGSADANLTSNADLIVPNNQSGSVHLFGSPANFNGNDPVGLFKNGVLIDIVGEENNGNNHIKDVTLRRKGTITSPKTAYDANEWDVLPKNTFDGIGSHTATLSIEKIDNTLFRLYPNPLNGSTINIVNPSSTKINELKVFNINGQEVLSIKKPSSSVDIKNISNGIYIVKLISDKGTSIKKLIKN